MYVCVRGKAENPRVYLMESYRKDGKPRNRIVKCYGYLNDLTKNDPDFLKNLKEIYAARESEFARNKKNFEAANAASALNLDNLVNPSFFNYKAPILNYSNLILQSL